MPAVTLKKSDPFEGLLCAIVELQRKKRADYASDEDPYQNFRRVAEGNYGKVGMTPREVADTLVGVKEERIRNIKEHLDADDDHEVENESLLDTYIDRAVYALLAAGLLVEEMEE